MTELIIGLGPIGAAVAERLIERGYSVVGFEVDKERAHAWANESEAPTASSPDDVDWSSIEAVHVAVRLASQLEQVLAMLRQRVPGALTVVVLTTLAPSDAERIFSEAPADWRVFEAPLSGGPQGARDGSMTLMLAGPGSSNADRTRFADMAARHFWTESYGQPALLKLLNNTLGAYNALATAAMLKLAVEHGSDGQQFLDVVNVSSGQSWMSTNFDNFHYPLLFKDAGLLIGDIGDMPGITLGDLPAHEKVIECARRTVFNERFAE